MAMEGTMDMSVVAEQVKSILPLRLRQLLHPFVPSFLKTRASVLRPGKAGLNPFNEETINRWFSSNTQMDSQLQEICARIESRSCSTVSFKDISHHLFGVDSVYAHYVPPETKQEGIYSTHIQQAALDRIVSLLGALPNLGIEVGSYVGHGACKLGQLFKSNNGVLLCVDTWCGDINMWLGSAFSSTMGKQDGNPDLYHHFMKRILDNGLDDTVIPVRVSSVVAARMIKVLGYEIDFVYLDSAHEAGETFLEMNLYYDLLKPGGVLLGDDFGCFPAVKYDVQKFLEFKGLNAELLEDKETWIIKKPQVSST
jgi:hypothetical protein